MSHKHHSSLPESHDSADQWHTHTFDEHPQDAHGESVAVPQLLLYGTACFAIVVISVVATAIYFYSYTYELAGKRWEHFDDGAPDSAKIQAEYNTLKQKAEADVVKGLHGDGGGVEKIVAQYSKR